MGYIYILTNPSFEEYVKIGYAKVVDDKHVEYDARRWSLTALAKHLLGVKWAMAGPRYFKYNGEWLNDIRHRLGR